MTLLIACVALLVSILGTWFARVSAKASKDSARESKRSADAAAAEDRRARKPDLSISRQTWAGYKAGEDSAIYEVVNNGPEHLASVVVHRPTPDTGINYSVSATGRTDWQDEAEIGPLRMTDSSRFTFCVGTWVDGERLPEFRVLIVCTSETGDRWELPFVLETPRTQPVTVAFARGNIRRSPGR